MVSTVRKEPRPIDHFIMGVYRPASSGTRRAKPQYNKPEPSIGRSISSVCRDPQARYTPNERLQFAPALGPFLISEPLGVIRPFRNGGTERKPLSLVVNLDGGPNLLGLLPLSAAPVRNFQLAGAAFL